MPIAFFTSRGAHLNGAIIDSIGNQLYNTTVVFKMCDSVPSARYFPFVMYYVYGESGSSLIIQCIDSMIQGWSKVYNYIKV